MSLVGRVVLEPRLAAQRRKLRTSVPCHCCRRDNVFVVHTHPKSLSRIPQGDRVTFPANILCFQECTLHRTEITAGELWVACGDHWLYRLPSGARDPEAICQTAEPLVALLADRSVGLSSTGKLYQIPTGLPIMTVPLAPSMPGDAYHILYGSDDHLYTAAGSHFFCDTTLVADLDEPILAMITFAETLFSDEPVTGLQQLAQEFRRSTQAASPSIASILLIGRRGRMCVVNVAAKNSGKASAIPRVVLLSEMGLLDLIAVCAVSSKRLLAVTAPDHACYEISLLPREQQQQQQNNSRFDASSLFHVVPLDCTIPVVGLCSLQDDKVLVVGEYGSVTVHACSAWKQVQSLERTMAVMQGLQRKVGALQQQTVKAEKVLATRIAVDSIQGKVEILRDDSGMFSDVYVTWTAQVAVSDVRITVQVILNHGCVAHGCSLYVAHLAKDASKKTVVRVWSEENIDIDAIRWHIVPSLLQ